MATAPVCSVPGCYRMCSKGRTSCNYHRNLAEKERDLARWAYRKLKANVKRRRDAAPEWKKGHYAFLLTLEEFRAFAVESEVFLGRGRSAKSMHIDRIKEELGYRAGNLRVLTNTDNVQKEHALRKGIIYDWELAYRRRTGRYSCEEEAKEDEGVSVFRVVVHGEETEDHEF